MASFIRAACLEGFHELVRSYQVNPNEILTQSGILTSQLRDPDNFISYDAFLATLEIASEKCDEPTFGLQLSMKQGVKTLGLIGAYMSRQATILEALTVAKKYMYLHAEGLLINVEKYQSNICELKFNDISSGSRFVPQKAQLTLGTCFRILQDLVGPKWRIEKVTFRQSPPSRDIHEFRQCFGCEATFNSDSDALYFQAQHLNTKPNLNDQLLDRMIQNEIKAKKPTSELDRLDHIENSIRTLLATGDCNKSNIALCMGLHPKKLQRILSDHDTSYRSVLENVRKKEAVRMLENDNVSLTTLALKLGYSELSIFSRNFKSWYGVTPSDWLKIHQDKSGN